MKQVYLVELVKRNALDNSRIDLRSLAGIYTSKNKAQKRINELNEGNSNDLNYNYEFRLINTNETLI